MQHVNQLLALTQEKLISLEIPGMLTQIFSAQCPISWLANLSKTDIEVFIDDA